MVVVAIAITLGTFGLLLFAVVRSIRNERTVGRSVRREFSLGLIPMILSFTTWIADLIAEWQVFTDEHLAHGGDPDRRLRGYVCAVDARGLAAVRNPPGGRALDDLIRAQLELPEPRCLCARHAVAGEM